MDGCELMDVSVLIPAYNAAHSLARTVNDLREFLSEHFPGNFEVILVPNGVPDSITFRETSDLAKALAGEYPEVRVCTMPPGVFGKGAALQHAFEVSLGERIFFTDADLPYGLSFFLEATELLDQGADLVLGNRRLPDSLFTIPGTVLPLAYNRYRLGLAFNRVVRFLFQIRTRDTQAGIRAMSRAFAACAFRFQACPGFLFDVEHALLATRNGFSIAEVPVHLYLRDEKSTVRLFRDGVAAVGWLARIFVRNIQGYYNFRRQILNVYRESPWPMKLFLWLRWGLTPYARMASELPRKGRVLDLGCGHGLFSFVVAASRPHGTVEGIDHDSERVAATQAAAREFPNARFLAADLQTVLSDQRDVDAISIVDTLHYFTADAQDKILRGSHESLADNGVLILREVDRSGGLRAWCNRLYERVATGIRFTKMQGEVRTYRSPEEWVSALRRVGFSVSWQRCSSVLFSDVLFVARKSQAT